MNLADVILMLYFSFTWFTSIYEYLITILFIQIILQNTQLQMEYLYHIEYSLDTIQSKRVLVRKS